MSSKKKNSFFSFAYFLSGDVFCACGVHGGLKEISNKMPLVTWKKNVGTRNKSTFDVQSGTYIELLP